MRALYWSCLAFVSIVMVDAVGCGGRLEVADCGQDRQYCADTNVCCPNFTMCGNGANGCPPGSCCLMTSSHVVDGGTDGDVTPVELPPVDMGPTEPTAPNEPGYLPGVAGGGGGGGQTTAGGQKRM